MSEVHVLWNRIRVSKRRDGTSPFVDQRGAGVCHLGSFLHERVRESVSESDGEWMSTNEEPKMSPCGQELMHTDV